MSGRVFGVVRLAISIVLFISFASATATEEPQSPQEKPVDAVALQREYDQKSALLADVLGKLRAWNTRIETATKQREELIAYCWKLGVAGAIDSREKGAILSTMKEQELSRVPEGVRSEVQKAWQKIDSLGREIGEAQSNIEKLTIKHNPDSLQAEVESLKEKLGELNKDARIEKQSKKPKMFVFHLKNNWETEVKMYIETSDGYQVQTAEGKMAFIKKADVKSIDK